MNLGARDVVGFTGWAAMLVAGFVLGIAYERPSASHGRAGIDAPMAASTVLRPSVEVHFSPHGGCTDAVVALVASATKTVRVQAYSFTSAPILDALAAAHARGIDVQILLDRSDEQPTAGRDPAWKRLADAGIPVRIDAVHPIAHSKVMIVDGEAVETGSYNYTVQAESNSENCPILRDAKLAEIYLGQWQIHAAHSRQPE